MRRAKQRGFGTLELILFIAVLGALGFASWYVWNSRQITPKQSSTSNTTPDYHSNGWSRTVTSGKGAFSITFPDGWKGIRRDTNSDAFMIGGEDQPEVKVGVAPQITSGPFGSDGPVVLFIDIVSGDTSTPHGSATDYVLENGKEHPIMGKKYSYRYAADQPEVEGIGAQRLEGDRDYAYIFDLGGGKKLEISYAVYASDPRNNIATIDELVQTIRLNS